MHPLAFILAVLAALLFLLAALGHEFTRVRLVPAGLAVTVVAWIVQLSCYTDDALVFFD